MEPRDIAKLRDKAAHLCLETTDMGKVTEKMDIHVSYWQREAEHALGELVAVLNERLREKEVNDG